MKLTLFKLADSILHLAARCITRAHDWLDHHWPEPSSELLNELDSDCGCVFDIHDHNAVHIPRTGTHVDLSRWSK